MDTAPRNGRCDIVYLYVTGIFTVLMSLIPIFRGTFLVPWIIPMWAGVYIVYRYQLVPENWKFLIAGLFLAGCYVVLGQIAETFNGTHHGEDVLNLEKSIFGVLPSRWFQSKLLAGRSGNWFDYPLALCHTTFFSFPFITPWLILRSRGQAAMKRAILAFALITTAGYATYILWPLTPPWLLAAEGVIEPLNRCMFAALTKITPAFMVSSACGTPRAAMPSLHSGVTLLMVLLLQTELGFKKSWWAYLLLLFICFEILYGAEHFVIDIAAGFAFAILAYLISRFVRCDRSH